MRLLTVSTEDDLNLIKQALDIYLQCLVNSVHNKPKIIRIHKIKRRIGMIEAKRRLRKEV